MCGMFVPDQSQALSLWSGSTASKTLDYQRTNPSRYQIMKESESEVTQSCATLCDPMDRSLPGFSVHGIFPARVLEWVAISFSRGSSQPRNRTRVSRVAGRRFTLWPIQRKPLEYKTWHHPTTSSTLCRMHHLNNKENKNTNPIISRQEYHLTQPCPSEEKQTNKQKLSTNLTLYEAHTNHWTKIRKPKRRKNSVFFKESWILSLMKVEAFLPFDFCLP